MTPQERIERWQEAFEVANGRDAPSVRYERGWYKFENLHVKKRAADVEEMTARLLRRVCNNC